jgi:cytochrome P450
LQPYHAAIDAPQILLFLAAGHETTANTLAFGLWRLALEPAVQNTLRAELRACPQLAPDVPADECTFRVLEGLPYLDGVVNEMFVALSSRAAMAR